MDYTDWHNAMLTTLGITDTNGIALWDEVEPRCIEYAELRIYRDPDLDFLYTRTSDLSATTAPAARQVPIPTEILIIEQANILTPANTLPAGGATRIPMLRISPDALNQMFPQESATSAPTPFGTYYAVLDLQPNWTTNAILIGPTPPAMYNVEFVGVFRPAPLSAENTTTFLTVNLPDLFLAASLIWGFGYLRDFGRQADDPQTAQSWEAQFQMLKKGAAVEEMRKKSLSVSGTPYVPTPLTKAPRGET